MATCLILVLINTNKINNTILSKQSVKCFCLCPLKNIKSAPPVEKL